MSIAPRLRSLVATLLLALIVGGCGIQSAFDIENGQCFDGGEADSEVMTVTQRDCAEPHEKEVFAVFDYPNPPNDYPGDQAIEDAVFARCVPEFKSFVGTDWESSELDFFYLVPTAETWGRGDREIVCAVIHPNDEKLTGSMRGSNR